MDEQLDEQLAAARQEAIDAYVAFELAADELSSALTGAARSAAQFRAHIEAGGATGELVGIAPVHSVRSSLTDQLARLEHTRLLTRTAVARLAHAEGRPLADLAKDWGVSRQYVWKLTRP